MIVLDCESTDSIYSSLEAISGAERGAIESFLKNIDLESVCKSSSPPRYPSNDFLLNAFARTFRSDLSYDATCWFHLTRTLETARFEDGILPLNQRLASIWDFLYGLLDGAISKQQWNKFKRDFLRSPLWPAQLYRMKTEKPIHWGPFAILIRDIAFKPKEVNNYDYLSSGPEIIEDICFIFEKLHQIDLLSIFQKKTKPCIVKFVDHHPEGKYVRAALWHLHAISRGEKCSSYCNDCFHGRGVPVPKDRILKIEFPPYGN